MEHSDAVVTYRVRVRTGYWHLHLATIASMLSLFAAAGHYNYAKSARLCLQIMNRLETSHPWLYDQFLLHGHTVRQRSNHFWAGVSTDLLIEQTMTKSLKSSSGLTHGRGFGEAVRCVWVESMHQSASMHLALKSIANLQPTAAVHTDCSTNRDHRDLMRVVEWLQQHHLFAGDEWKLTWPGAWHDSYRK